MSAVAHYHAIIAHGRALAECLHDRRAVSDSRQRISVAYDEVHGRWNSFDAMVSERIQGEAAPTTKGEP